MKTPTTYRNNLRLPVMDEGVERVTINIGGLRASSEPMVIDTVLGS